MKILLTASFRLVHHVLEHLHKGRPPEKDSLLARCMDTVLSHGHENQGQVATLPDLLQAQLESHRRRTSYILSIWRPNA